MRLGLSTLIGVSLLLLLGEAELSARPFSGPPSKNRSIAIVVGKQAPEIENYAADQLSSYIEKLFGIAVQPTNSVPPSVDAVFLIGSPRTNPAVDLATAHHPFPRVSDQGIVLLRTELGNRPALVVAGGSPPATLWAVYELVGHWGVHYLLHGDVLPRSTSEFHLPNLTEVIEPKLYIRGWRVINDFASGMEAWGIRDYRPLLDQLAKMKVNRLFLSIWPWQPFLDYHVDGIYRRSAWLWFDYHYPITPGMVGRELFRSAKEFWNPDIPMHASYEQMTEAGERLIHRLAFYAHSRGMKCVISASPLEFPPEFAPLLRGGVKVHQLGKQDVVPGPNTPLDDPGLFRLASAVLRATVNTYPEADYVAIDMPEFRQWTKDYQSAWQALDRKYRISQVRTLNQVLAATAARSDYPGGPERALDEVKGDIASLSFYDHVLRSADVLRDTRRPDMKFIYVDVAEELFPVLPRLMPHGWELMNFIGYTPSRVLRRAKVLTEIPGREVPTTLIYTLQDDNIGLVPQLTTSSLYNLTQDLVRDGWAGFFTRYWLIGDQDPSAAYLARGAWDANATPDVVNRRQLEAVCGTRCANDMLQAFHEVERVTENLEWNNLGFSFPVPGMMMKHWKVGPMPADLVEDRQGYEKALRAVTLALRESDPPGRSNYLDYWEGRLEFAVDYLNAVDAVHRAATEEAAHSKAKALLETKVALAEARHALAAYAAVARDQSDRGAIAVMNEYVHRPLKEKVKELGGE